MREHVFFGNIAGEADAGYVRVLLPDAIQVARSIGAVRAGNHQFQSSGVGVLTAAG